MSDFVLDGEGISFGDVHVRLAKNEEEVLEAQRLRYKIFYEEFNATPSDEQTQLKRDFDRFDDHADHLVVIDKTSGEGQIVGTYRMLDGDGAKKAGQFYTSDEFDISLLINNYSGLLEMGRSCVLEPYRTRAVLQLLWQGIAEYVAYHNIKFLFGCASFHGTDAQDHAEALTYLYHNHLAPKKYRPKALPDVYTDMDLMAVGDIDERRVWKNLPPLVKGYLRIGGKVGDGAFIDHNFGSTDVCVVLNTAQLTESYKNHYSRKTGADFSGE